MSVESGPECLANGCEFSKGVALSIRICQPLELRRTCPLLLLPLNCGWRVLALLAAVVGLFGLAADRYCFAQESASRDEASDEESWVMTTAHLIPSEYTSEESGYFSIVEGPDGHIYIGTAKYQQNAYLMDFDPAIGSMRMVLDAEAEIGIDLEGFAAQAKFHTRNNVGASGKIYLGTKQGYAQNGESFEDYPGGYPMVFDPLTGETRVYDIPVAHHGIISIAPDESRGVAYLSTCSDERPIESTHFMKLDLETGEYRDLLDCRHMYAFVVVDDRGRAYHPVLGGKIARYDPQSDRLEQLEQLIDGQPPTADSFLAHPESHPINWDISPDRKTLYAVAMSVNQLIAYDLTGEGDVLEGRTLGPLVADATSTDCRALAVAPNGTVWAGVAATIPEKGTSLRVVSWSPEGQAAGEVNRDSPIDRGPIAIGSIDGLRLEDEQGQTRPWHHGIERRADGKLVPRFVIMGICGASDGTVYLTTLYPFTLHAIRFDSK